MHSVTSNAVAERINYLARFNISDLSPTGLGFQQGATVNIWDLTNLLCIFLGNGRCCVNIHFVWAYADMIVIDILGTQILSAGLTIIGNISRKEYWTNQQFLLLTESGATYRVVIIIFESLENFTVRITQINGDL